MSQIAEIVDKCRCGERITASEALQLWQQAPLWQLSALAVEAKRKVSGDKVYYNRNFHLEPTNVCLFECTLINRSRYSFSSARFSGSGSPSLFFIYSE